MVASLTSFGDQHNAVPQAVADWLLTFPELDGRYGRSGVFRSVEVLLDPNEPDHLDRDEQPACRVMAGSVTVSGGPKDWEKRYSVHLFTFLHGADDELVEDTLKQIHATLEARLESEGLTRAAFDGLRSKVRGAGHTIRVELGEIATEYEETDEGEVLPFSMTGRISLELVFDVCAKRAPYYTGSDGVQSAGVATLTSDELLNRWPQREPPELANGYYSIRFTTGDANLISATAGQGHRITTDTTSGASRVLTYQGSGPATGQTGVEFGIYKE